MKSLKGKFLIPITSIVLFSLTLGIGLVATISSSLLAKNARMEMESRINTLSGVMNSYLEDRSRDLRCWSDLKINEDFFLDMENDTLRKHVNDQLYLLTQNYPIYQSVNLIDLSGDVVASSVARKGKFECLEDNKPVVNLKERSYFKGALQGEITFSNVIISKVTEEPVLCIGAPVYHEGAVSGVIYAVLDMKLFTDKFVTPVKMGESGYAYVINREGILIAHPQKEFILNNEAAERFTFLKTMAESTEKLLRYKWEKEQKLVAFETIPVTGWKIALGVTENEIYSTVRTLKLVGVFILALALLFTIGLITYLVNRILVGIRNITETSDALALGDLTKQISFTSDDEIGVMADAFRRMQSNLIAKTELAQKVASGDLTCAVPIASENDTLGIALQEMIDKTSRVLMSIQKVSDSVDMGSSQVSSLSSELSDGSVQSASAIEQISSSMNVIGSQSEMNAKTAQKVSGLMVEANSIVTNASDEMSTLENAMEKINNSSIEIGKVIKVIDDIAFQTNLLALNAAVEAARAGVHGKGFAVVADEVRNLAGRSAKAAQETELLIQDAMNNARSGAEITGRTSAVFDNIRESVQSVSEFVENITSGSLEQSQGIEQIVAGISQIEGVINQNSASSEETAAASAELSAMAEQLKSDLARFRIDMSPGIENEQFLMLN